MFVHMFLFVYLSGVECLGSQSGVFRGMSVAVCCSCVLIVGCVSFVGETLFTLLSTDIDVG